MNNTSRESLRKFEQSFRQNRKLLSQLCIVGLLVLFAGFGSQLLSRSHAATPFVSAEVESGTASGSASVVSDTTASGGKAVRFTGSITPPPSTKPLMGAATKGDTLTSWDAFEGLVGKLQARRTYDTALPSTFAASHAAADPGRGLVTYWSFKPDPATFASGSMDTAFKSFLNSIPAGHRTTIALYHEPEDQITGGTFTLADWKAANNHMGALIHATGRSELRSMIVFVGPWNFNPQSPFYGIEFWDSGFTANIDMIGIDPYATNDKYVDIINQPGATAMMDWIHLHNKPFGITEYGSHVAIGQTIDMQQKADWLTREWAWAKSAGAQCNLYFDVNAVTGLPDADSNIIFTGTAPQTALQAIVADAKL